MRRGVYTLAGLCVLVVVGLSFVPAVHANTSDHVHNVSEPSYQIVQGEQVIPVEPIDGDEPVEEFYEYRHSFVGDRDHEFWGRSFSSEGTVEYQEDDTSILMLYDGPDGLSLVAVHDRYHEEQAEGTTGGSVSWELTGLPEDGEWAVIDDDYGWLTEEDDKDDIFYLDEDHRDGAAGNDGEPPAGVDAMMSWVWLTGRTDGMAFRGLGTEPSITIDPSFNDDSYHRYGDHRRADELPDRPDRGERYNGTVDDWQVIVPTDDDEFERVSLQSLDDPVEVRSTESDTDRAIPEITIDSIVVDNTTVETNEQTQISTLVENTGEADGIYTLRLSVAGVVLERETVRVAAGDQQTVEFTHSFAAPGEYELSINSEQVDLTVEASEDDTGGTDSGETDSSEDEIPGFGVFSALAALLAVAVAARRRR